MGKEIIHAWIGKHCKVIASKNPSLTGVEGTVVDETENFVVIETNNGEKKIPRNGTTFKV